MGFWGSEAHMVKEILKGEGDSRGGQRVSIRDLAGVS